MKILLPVFMLLLVLSCKKNGGDGGYHLPPKVMQQVLMDVNLAESYSTIVKDSVHRKGAKNFDSLSVYYKAILDHYKITEEQFSESYNWYRDHPEKLDTAYAGILPIIIREQKTPQALPATPPAILPAPVPVPQKNRDSVRVLHKRNKRK